MYVQCISICCSVDTVRSNSNLFINPMVLVGNNLKYGVKGALLIWLECNHYPSIMIVHFFIQDVKTLPSRSRTTVSLPEIYFCAHDPG